MRKTLPALFLATGIFIFSQPSSGQNDRFAYAVTDVQQGTYNWSHLRKLNLQTGEYSSILLNGADMDFRAYNASTKKQFETPVTDARYGLLANAPFGTGVAAMAFDKRSNRLYYTPMFVDQLRYIDLKSMKVFYVTDEAFTGKGQKAADQSDIVTRMVIASDGFGYAMTNDGNQLIRFSTGKKTQVTDLGAVVDDPDNGHISIHNSCSSYGGDMIADDNGNLYIFSARNHVFRVNIETKVAKYLGFISGLPAGFTINGVAVTTDNKIIAGSAAQAASYFLIDYRSLEATPYTLNGPVLNSSDLANSNLLNTGAKSKTTTTEIISKMVPETADAGKITIFPNPVTGNQFMVRFNGLEQGAYTIRVTDVTGRQVMQQAVTVSGDIQSQQVTLDPAAAKGVYLVKVADTKNTEVFTTKIIVQ